MSPTPALSNHELVTLALYLRGSDGDRVDTEDVAIQVRALDPGRFSWRKHHDQINLELVRVALSDAKKPENGRLVAGSGNEGWSLTADGLAFSKANLARIMSNETGGRPPHPRERQWFKRERARMLSTQAYGLFRQDRLNEITPALAAVFFHLDDYIRGPARDRKVSRLAMAFSDDKELASAVQEIRGRLGTDDPD